MARRQTAPAIHTITLNETEYAELRSMFRKMRESYLKSAPVSRMTNEEARLSEEIFGEGWWQD